MNIKRYYEQLVEWYSTINSRHEDMPISGIRMAVREGQMNKKLKDCAGVWLCSNYPDFSVSAEEDNLSADYGILVYLVEKVPSGSMTSVQELEFYNRMQQLMGELMELIVSSNWGCMGLEIVPQLRVEWEYDIFGGFSGLSVSFHAKDAQV